MARRKLVMDIERRKRRDILNTIERLRTKQMQCCFETLSNILKSNNINKCDTKLSIIQSCIKFINHLENQIKLFESENLMMMQHVFTCFSNEIQ